MKLLLIVSLGIMLSGCAAEYGYMKDGKDGVNGTNGTNGSNGVNGEDSESYFTILDPCGNAPGLNDQILLKLADGTVISSDRDNNGGKNTRLARLEPGTYLTTDGDNCTFSIDMQGNIFSESHTY